jgi:hypothetical protein
MSSIPSSALPPAFSPGRTAFSAVSPLPPQFRGTFRASGSTAADPAQAASPVASTTINPQLEQRMARYFFHRYTPKPKRFFQKAVFELNRFIFFSRWFSWAPWHRGTFRFADADSLKRLRALPGNAGVILAGAHPDMSDAHMLAEIHRQADRFPALIPFSNETWSGYVQYIPASLLFLLKPIFSALGLAPVDRGNRNQHLKEHGLRMLGEGRWLSIFPEGGVHLGPRVFPMQKGAVEMALKAAALQAAQPPETSRPILLQPFAHVWVYEDSRQTGQAMRKTVAQLERQLAAENVEKSFSGGFVNESSDLHTRIFELGIRLLERTRKAHALTPPDGWERMNFWEQAQWLRETGLSVLEKRYGLSNGPDRPGHRPLTHNRLMKVRTKIWEQRAGLSGQVVPMHQSAWTRDLKRADDLSVLNAFVKDDLRLYGDGKRLDMDMLAVCLRRLCGLAGWKAEPALGRRRVVVQPLKPVDMRQYADQAARLTISAEKEGFAIKLTKELLEIPIQKAIGRLRQECLKAVP